MGQIATVNVIEMDEHTILSLRSWKDNAKGNKDAEKVFVRLIEEYFGGAVDGELLDRYLDDGFYVNDDGSYEVSILHTTIDKGDE